MHQQNNENVRSCENYSFSHWENTTAGIIIVKNKHTCIKRGNEAHARLIKYFFPDLQIYKSIMHSKDCSYADLVNTLQLHCVENIYQIEQHCSY